MRPQRGTAVHTVVYLNKGQQHLKVKQLRPTLYADGSQITMVNGQCSMVNASCGEPICPSRNVF